MEIVRAGLGLDPPAYRTDARLTEVGFGGWEGFSIDELRAREADAVAARERDKWDFVPPRGESYAAMSLRVAAWYATLTRDTVAVAHGGTFRGLIVRLGIMSAQEAPALDIAQGVVYLIADGRMTRYA
jgi:probable phosphoglycerate mutase